MRAPQRLVVIAAALALTSCTAYVHNGPSHARRAYDADHPCPYDAQSGVIGLSIGRPDDTTHGPIFVERVAPGSPAGDANIQPGDQIRSVDGEATQGMTLSEAARVIRGRPGAAVELRIESPRGARLVTLVRVAYVPSHEHGGGGRGRCHHHKSHPPCNQQGGEGRPCGHCAGAHEPPPTTAAPVADDDARQ